MTTTTGIPTEVWEMILNYTCPVDYDGHGFHPLDPESRFLSREVTAALDERILDVTTMLPDCDTNRSTVTLRLKHAGVVASRPVDSLYSQTRGLFALCHASRERLLSVRTIEGEFLCREPYFMDDSPSTKGEATLLIDSLHNALQGMSNLSSIEGPFLKSCSWLKVVDLRHMTKLKEIGSDFLSFSSVEEVHLPSSLGVVGDRFLNATQVQSLDLSMTGLTAVGDEFLANTPLLSISFPSTLQKIGMNFLAFLSDGEHCNRLDLSATALEAAPDGFLRECRFEEVSLPGTLRTMGDECLIQSKATRLDLSNSAVESVGNRFLAFSSVEVLLLPQSLKVVGDEFLHQCTARRMDFTATSLEVVGDGFLSYSSTEEVLLPQSLKEVGRTFLSGSTATRVDLKSTSLERVGQGLLASSSTEVVLLPESLKDAGNFFLAGSTANRVDLTSTSLETVGDGFRFRSLIEEVLLPPSLKRSEIENRDDDQ